MFLNLGDPKFYRQLLLFLTYLLKKKKRGDSRNTTSSRNTTCWEVTYTRQGVCLPNDGDLSSKKINQSCSCSHWIPFIMSKRRDWSYSGQIQILKAKQLGRWHSASSPWGQAPRTPLWMDVASNMAGNSPVNWSLNGKRWENHLFIMIIFNRWTHLEMETRNPRGSC